MSGECWKWELHERSECSNMHVVSFDKVKRYIQKKFSSFLKYKKASLRVVVDLFMLGWTNLESVTVSPRMLKIRLTYNHIFLRVYKISLVHQLRLLFISLYSNRVSSYIVCVLGVKVLHDDEIRQKYQRILSKTQENLHDVDKFVSWLHQTGTWTTSRCHWHGIWRQGKIIGVTSFSQLFHFIWRCFLTFF